MYMLKRTKTHRGLAPEKDLEIRLLELENRSFSSSSSALSLPALSLSALSLSTLLSSTLSSSMLSVTATSPLFSTHTSSTCSFTLVPSLESTSLRTHVSPATATLVLIGIGLAPATRLRVVQCIPFETWTSSRVSSSTTTSAPEETPPHSTRPTLTPTFFSTSSTPSHIVSNTGLLAIERLRAAELTPTNIGSLNFLRMEVLR